jgi:nicotinate phosphoribosyltransferase
MGYTDKYFEKTKNCVDPDTIATYGVFLRHDVICAVDRAISFLQESGVTEIDRHYLEGALVPAESPLFSYTAKLRDIVTLETMMLQLVGVSCISAYNAFKMSMVCPTIPFLDMHARHATGPSMVYAAAYGASVGSKSAQMQGAKGFIGSSLDETAEFYGGKVGLGTMPHVLIGYAGGTLAAVQLFMDKNPDDMMITALVDYYGREVHDSLEVADWWKFSEESKLRSHAGKTLAVRLDTHGGRFMEELDYDSSVAVVGDWLHKKGKWPIVKTVMGDDAFDIASDAIRDSVAKLLFGTGVSAASIIHMRCRLDRAGHKNVKIVASSGFNLRKCRIMAKVAAPIDMIGTGSFLPDTLSETYTTADVYAYNGVFSVKVGRESVFKPVFKE